MLYQQDDVEIYIPLCIYFNHRSKPERDTTISFTFHYVSISTRKYQNINNDSSDLHSTMYLFQREPENYQSRRIYIYIPLCIYFNLNACQQHSPSPKFTFHYVSISTVNFFDTPLPLYNLHSTMYLFQLAALIVEFPIIIYLHSTMYLFQQAAFVKGCIFNNIYIPLCIYFNTSINPAAL